MTMPSRSIGSREVKTHVPQTGGAVRVKVSCVDVAERVKILWGSENDTEEGEVE